MRNENISSKKKPSDFKQSYSLIHGISLVELILVVVILSILAVSGVSFGSGFLIRSNLADKTNELVSSLRTAQVNAMSGKENGKWGVRVDSGLEQIIMFQGDNYTSRNPVFDQIFEISGYVAITNTEVVFDENTGNPASVATIVVSNSLGDSHTVSVNEVGIVNVN